YVGLASGSASAEHAPVFADPHQNALAPAVVAAVGHQRGAPEGKGQHVHADVVVAAANAAGVLSTGGIEGPIAPRTDHEFGMFTAQCLEQPVGVAAQNIDGGVRHVDV